jgi:hypothetical protein
VQFWLVSLSSHFPYLPQGFLPIGLYGRNLIFDNMQLSLANLKQMQMQCFKISFPQELEEWKSPFLNFIVQRAAWVTGATCSLTLSTGGDLENADLKLDLQAVTDFQKLKGIF